VITIIKFYYIILMLVEVFLDSLYYPLAPYDRETVLSGKKFSG